MGVYSKYVFPSLCDYLLDQPFLNEHRRRQLADVQGEVLEIGAGTGLNLPQYPAHIRRITTIDPNPGMNRKLRRRIKATGIEVDQRMIRCEELPFDDERFDSVVSTLTLCSIVKVEDALRELIRVLKPGGHFHFFEHGLSPDPVVQKRQRRWNWLQHIVGDGCRLDLNVADALRSQTFREVAIDHFYLERTPHTHGYIYRGVATK